MRGNWTDGKGVVDEKDLEPGREEVGLSEEEYEGAPAATDA